MEREIPRAADWPTKRNRILETAAQLFEERGYSDTSLEAVAVAAGIGKATIYHYYRSKDDILSSLHNELISMLETRMEDRIASSVSALERTKAVIFDIMENMECRRGHVRVFVENLRHLSDVNRAEAENRRNAYAASVEAAITEAMEEGTFRRCSARIATLVLFGIANWAYQWFDPAGDLSASEVAEVMWKIYYGGIAAESDQLSGSASHRLRADFSCRGQAAAPAGRVNAVRRRRGPCAARR